MSEPTKETLDEWHKDPTNWKWGIFYFNKKDKRLFPPKKIKALGWTVNFSNPLSISALFVITAIILVLSNYLKKY